jgi:hypothetical protein
MVGRPMWANTGRRTPARRAQCHISATHGSLQDSLKAAVTAPAEPRPTLPFLPIELQLRDQIEELHRVLERNPKLKRAATKARPVHKLILTDFMFTFLICR